MELAIETPYQNYVELEERRIDDLKIKEIIATKRSMILLNAQLCFVSQFILCVFIVEQIYYTDLSDLVDYELLNRVDMCRIACSIILHQALIDEATTGNDMMKFVLNHSYRFEDWYYPF